MVVRCIGAGAGAERDMLGRAAGRADMLGARPPTRPPERPASAASIGEKVSAIARSTDIAGFFQSVAAIRTGGAAGVRGLPTTGASGVVGKKDMGTEAMTIADIKIRDWRVP